MATTDKALALRTTAQFSPEVRERAYLIWAYEAGESPARTAAQLAAALLAEARLADTPDPDTPDRDVIRRWASRDGWAARRHDELVADDRIGAIYFQQKAQIILGYGQLLTDLLGLLDLPNDEGWVVNAKVKLLDHLAKSGGHQQLIVQAPHLPAGRSPTKLAALDLAAMSPEERARKRQEISANSMERIRRAKQPAKGKQ